MKSLLEIKLHNLYCQAVICAVQAGKVSFCKNASVNSIGHFQLSQFEF